MTVQQLWESVAILQDAIVGITGKLAGLQMNVSVIRENTTATDRLIPEIVTIQRNIAEHLESTTGGQAELMSLIEELKQATPAGVVKKLSDFADEELQRSKVVLDISRRSCEALSAASEIMVSNSEAIRNMVAVFTRPVIPPSTGHTGIQFGQPSTSDTGMQPSQSSSHTRMQFPISPGTLSFMYNQC